MKPKDFFQAVLDSKNMRPNALAKAIRMPTRQGSISKFLSGDVADPRSAWVKLAANHLGFDPAALRDEDVAAREASRLGLVGVASPKTYYRVQTRAVRQTPIDPGMLILQIADLMRGYTLAQRELAAPLFHGAARSPDEATNIANALRALLSSKAA